MAGKKRIISTILILVLLLPFWLWLAWFLTPKRNLEVAILDKTVLTTKGQEHTSLTWMLNNNRFAKRSDKLYKAAKDYFGFFPEDNFEYKLKGLERFTPDQLDQLSDDADLLYITDTYGIYKNEWFSSAQNTERSGMVYGGLSRQDVQLLGNMKQRNKLIITEFNTIGSPTADFTRLKFEEMFKMRWTGWTARYFPILDTTKTDELPSWLINNYKRQHAGKWDFHKAGIAFVNTSDEVVILEEDVLVSDPMTYISSRDVGKTALNLPDKVRYPFWFDVIIPDQKVNTIAASFMIHTNEKGKAELQSHGIPLEIPAVIFHKDKDYRFYYFSGDFCDNPITMTSSYFKGIRFFSGLFYNSDNKEDRSAFFWRFYHPMMKRILNDYYKDLHP